jgi:hypothetical protein
MRRTIVMMELLRIGNVQVVSEHEDNQMAHEQSYQSLKAGILG